jgi:hypothetical protein
VVPVDETDPIVRRDRDDTYEIVRPRSIIAPPVDAATIRRVRLFSSLRWLTGRYADL